MDKNIRLTPKLPTGDANGMADPDVIRRLLDDPAQMRVGIVIFNLAKVETETDSGDIIGRARIRRIEAILDDTLGDASALQRLLMRSYERRTGQTTLEEGLEEDVREAFDGLSLLDMEAEELLGGEEE